MSIAAITRFIIGIGFPYYLKVGAILEKVSETMAKPKDAEAGIIRSVRSSQL